MKNIKVIIPCAGNGTRDLPFSAFIPKELIPVPADGGYVKSAVHDLVDKVVESGIPFENIFLVVSQDKYDLFKKVFSDRYEGMIKELYSNGKNDFARIVEKIPIFSEDQLIIQEEGVYGNATPLYAVRNVVRKNDYILYLYPDDLFLTKKESDIQQMLAAHQKYGGGIFAAKRVLSDGEYDKYGFVDGELVRGSGGKIMEVKTIVEKPGKEKAPSDFASVSGYLFVPGTIDRIIVAHDEFVTEEQDGEFMLQPIVQAGIDDGDQYYAIKIDGDYHDTGNHDDYANLWSAVAK